MSENRNTAKVVSKYLLKSHIAIFLSLITISMPQNLTLILLEKYLRNLELHLRLKRQYSLDLESFSLSEVAGEKMIPPLCSMVLKMD